MTKIIILDNASQLPPLFREYPPDELPLRTRIAYQIAGNRLLRVAVKEKNA